MDENSNSNEDDNGSSNETVKNAEFTVKISDIETKNVKVSVQVDSLSNTKFKYLCDMYPKDVYDRNMKGYKNNYYNRDKDCFLQCIKMDGERLCIGVQEQKMCLERFLHF